MDSGEEDDDVVFLSQRSTPASMRRSIRSKQRMRKERQANAETNKKRLILKGNSKKGRGKKISKAKSKAKGKGKSA